MSFILITSAFGRQQSTSSDKIYSVINQTIELMKSEGITAKNARQMSVAKKYNSLMTQFDQTGRFGLILDVKNISSNLLAYLGSLGCEIRLTVPEANLISVYSPIDKIESIAELEDVKIIRPIMQGVSNTGSVTSEGDTVHHALDVRNELNVNGDLVNVGVISDGCTNWVQSQILGDLPNTFGPGNYTFQPPANNCIGSGDEGTAMMEIVNDISPNSNLYFYGALGIGGGSPTMIDAIKRLVREKNCDVIVDDLTYFDQPMFEDGTPATAGCISAWAKWANDTGVVYISSAGNWAKGGNTDRSHYQSMYNDIDPIHATPGVKPLPNGPIPIPPPNQPPPNVFDNLHDFNTAAGFDPGLQVIIPGYSGTGEPPRMYVILEWTDPTGVMPDAWGASSDDYDLYLYDKNLVIRKASSTNNQVGAQNPYEALWYYNIYPTPETLNVVITHFGPFGTPAKLLGMYISGCSWVEYNTPENSIWGQPGVPEVIAVGGVNYNDANSGYIYSSRGNYDVYVPAFSSRPKPDVVALTGGVITGVGGFGFWDGTNWRFWGTSASAPHVAGMTALLLSKYPAFTPAQVHSKFERTAVDLGVAGFDQIFGNGRLDIELALLELDKSVGSDGPYTMNNTVGSPMFFGTSAGYASNTITISGGIWPPATVSSTVNVSSDNPYTDASVLDPGCPTVKRWYQFTQTLGLSRMYSSDITAYIDETERAASGINSDDLRIIHWNGNYFNVLPTFASAKKVGNTWKVTGRDLTADFSPFFIGHLTRGIALTPPPDTSGRNDSTIILKYSLKNTGNGWDTLSINIADNKGWSISPNDTALSLTSNQEVQIEYSVKISSSDPVGTIDTLQIIAQSISDTNYKDTAYTTIEITLGESKITHDMLVGWNMLSLPLLVTDQRKEIIYPTAISKAFGYDGSYTIAETLKYSLGYWVKFDSAESIDITGYKFENDTIDVIDKWNMIGCPSEIVPVDSIASIPGGIITSNFFGFDGSTYKKADTLKPGYGYWVKVNQAGQLILRNNSSIAMMNRIKIRPTSEMPPPPPDGEIISNIEYLISNFALEQNYPNPFNPLTIISYQLPIDNWVTIKVYNLLGVEMATLVNEDKKVGKYEVEFDASTLPSGIYFYRLTSGLFIETKKLILIR
ncbi:MAG: S8 family peptidase [Ignavibacteriales bacterium]|nr:S8 family peptidase [Ignavibacteriales bacterium]